MNEVYVTYNRTYGNSNNTVFGCTQIRSNQKATYGIFHLTFTETEVKLLLFVHKRGYYT